MAFLKAVQERMDADVAPRALSSRSVDFRPERGGKRGESTRARRAPVEIYTQEDIIDSEIFMAGKASPPPRCTIVVVGRDLFFPFNGAQ